MLIKNKEDLLNSFAFFFQDTSQHEVAHISSIGYEKRKSQDYHLDEKEHRSFAGIDIEKYIFQYTLSGNGLLEIGSKQYQLSSGTGFFIRYPSDASYYLPDKAEDWEFIFITLHGKQAAKCWEKIIEKYGQVLEIPSNSSIVQELFNILKETKEKEIDNPYTLSKKAYSFIMECYAYFKRKSDLALEIPKNIEESLNFIYNSYDKPISLDEIAQASGISKYHFIKKFKESMNVTPNQFLMKYRIRKAMEGLQRTDKSIKAIALSVGFNDANYFSKVFKSLVGTSPGEFRERTSAKSLILD